MKPEKGVETKGEEKKAEVVIKARKVKCSGCGKLKFVNAKALKSRLEKFGSIEQIEELWLCSACVRAEKSKLNK